MAIDEADQSDSGQFEGEEPPDGGNGSSARVGEYTWGDFMDEYGYSSEVSTLYPDGKPQRGADELGLSAGDEAAPYVPSGSDWNRVDFDPEAYLGFHPDDLEDRITDTAAANAKYYHELFMDYVDPETTPVVKDLWSWEHFKWEYYYDENGNRPRKNGEVVDFDPSQYLSFDPDETEATVSRAGDIAKALDDTIEERTVDVNSDLDEDEFFSTVDGHTTLVNRYDLEKAVPLRKKTHFQEEERYWVNKPYAFVIIFHSRKENEKKYYLIEPNLNEIEEDLKEFLTGKLRTAIKYADENVAAGGDEEHRKTVIERETKKLLRRYDLFEKYDAAGESGGGFLQNVLEMMNQDEQEESEDGEGETTRQLQGLSVRPEPILLEEDPDRLSEYQVEKLLYLLKRDFIGYEQIDGIKHDINVEDISCDGYNSPVFVYHTDYEQIISNVYHGESELDDFVVKLAQRSGKGISKRRPQVDATLPDGSRAQLTLGREVSDHGTNYTIRQFKDVPFTPIDLVNWNTFSLEEMAFLWLCIENHKSLIFAGGTASGKTTSLNAVSLFIPSNTKIVSIEDTREVELPQRNWVASVTRPSFSDDDQGDVDEFDLLEAALRQRPDYIVMGEIRGEEGRTLFQVMSTGHTTYTTFHADSVGEVLKRFTTDPINVSKTMFTALDLVSIQTQTRVQGNKVRRNKKLTEVNHYDADTDEINVQDVYQWQAETDEFLKMGDSNTLAEIKFDRGWSQERLETEIFKREVILAYLIKNGLNEYTKVAATVQAFINDPDTILTLIANGQLEESLEDLREMESVQIQVDPEKEELVPRPDPDEEGYNLAMDILEQAEEALFEDYRGDDAESLQSAIGGMADADSDFKADESSTDDFEFGGEVDDEFGDEEFEFGDGDAFTVTDDGSFEEADGATADAEPDSGEVEADIEDLWEDTETPALEEGADETDADRDPDRPAIEAGMEAEAQDADEATDPASETERQMQLDGDDASAPALDSGESAASPDSGSDLPETIEETDADPGDVPARPDEETEPAPPDTPDDDTGSPPATPDSESGGFPAEPDDTDDTPAPPVSRDNDSSGVPDTDDADSPATPADPEREGDDGDGSSPFDDTGGSEDPVFGSDDDSGDDSPFGSDSDDGSDSGSSVFGSDDGDDDDDDGIFSSDDGDSSDGPTREGGSGGSVFGDDATDTSDDGAGGSGDSPFGDSGGGGVFDDSEDADTDAEDGGSPFEDGEDIFGGGDEDDDDISGFEDVSFEFDEDEDNDES